MAPGYDSMVFAGEGLQVMFEALLDGEEIILRLNSYLPGEAASILCGLQRADEHLLRALAELLAGDPRTNPELSKQYNYRLALASWGVSGPRPTLSPVSLTHPQEDAVIVALNAGDRKAAAEALRTLEHAGSELLRAIADLIGGDAHKDPTLRQRYRYRLKLAPWGMVGRKQRTSTARALNNADHKPKNKLRKPFGAGPDGEAIYVPIGDKMLAAKVQRLVNGGTLRKDALLEVAESHYISVSKVEKAFDTYRRRIKPARPEKSE